MGNPTRPSASLGPPSPKTGRDSEGLNDHSKSQQTDAGIPPRFRGGWRRSRRVGFPVLPATRHSRSSHVRLLARAWNAGDCDLLRIFEGVFLLLAERPHV